MDRVASDQTYDKGDLILLYSPAVRKGSTSNLHRPWRGPGVILKRTKDVLFRVKMGPQNKPKLIISKVGKEKQEPDRPKRDEDGKKRKALDTTESRKQPKKIDPKATLDGSSKVTVTWREIPRG